MLEMIIYITAKLRLEFTSRILRERNLILFQVISIKKNPSWCFFSTKRCIHICLLKKCYLIIIFILNLQIRQMKNNFISWSLIIYENIWRSFLSSYNEQFFYKVRYSTIKNDMKETTGKKIVREYIYNLV